MHKDTVLVLAGWKRLENDYKAPDMLFKVNKADIAGMIEVIKEYLSSHHGVIRTPFAYVINMIIMVYDYPKCATLDDEMINKML